MTRSWKLRTVAAVLAVATLTGGCYGPFNLTKRFHSWQGSVTENKWGQEVVFLLTSIVYGFTTLADAVILNSIEFWGYENPVSASSDVMVLEDGDLSIRLERTDTVDGRSMRVAVSENGELVRDYTMVAGEDGTRLHDASGRLVATACADEGGEVVLHRPCETR